MAKKTRIRIQPWMVMMTLPSEALGPDEHGHEVKEEPKRGDRGEPEFEGHRSDPSRIVAQPDIGERCRHQS
jgi:hypothetical protein